MVQVAKTDRAILALQLGQELELHIVEHALEKGRAGRPSLVLVEGGPGMGKTRLLEQARAAAARRDMRVLAARGHPLERDFPFALAVQLFDPVVRDAASADREQVFAGAARLARPALGLEPVRSPPDEDDFEALRGLYSLSANLAREGPLVMLIDDLHWADAASRRWLDHLVQRLDGLSLTVVAAAGAGSAAAARWACGTVPLERATTVVRLAPWTQARSARWLRDRPPEAKNVMWRIGLGLARGVPLLLDAVASAVQAEQLSDATADEATLRAVSQRAVARIGLARLARLPEDAIGLAEAIAVLGSSVTLRRAASLARMSPDEAASLADLLADGGVLVRGTMLEFAHPLSRETVYAGMSLADRLVQHARATTVLVENASPPEIAAEHVLAGEVGAVPQAFELLRAAARDALGRGAPDAAARYLRRAMAEPGAAEVRPAVVRELGMALLLSLEPDACGVLSEAMELMQEPGARAACGLDLARGLGARGRPREAVEACLLVVDEPVPDALAGQIEAELAACASRVPEKRELVVPYREHVERRSAAAPDLRVPALELRATALACAAGPADDVVALLQEPLGAGLPGGPSPMRRSLVLEALLVCDAEPASSLIDAGLEAARARGDRAGIAELLTLRACAHLRAGRLAETRPVAEEALALKCPHGVGPHMGWAAGMLADVLLETGHLSQAGDSIGQALSSTELAGDDVRTAQLLERRARVRASAGDVEPAIADAHRAGELLCALDITNPALCAWRSRAALLLDSLGRHAAARDLADEELRLARSFGRPRAIGVALHRSGLLGRSADLETLRGAVAALEAAPAPLELAWALLDLGSALRRASEREVAREPLRRALHIADDLGASVLADGARAELLAAGARPRRARLTGPGALTASEHRVATLAAQGLSNRQIATVLFVTRRTVEVHLTRSYQKLGITSRSQLADTLTGRDAPAPQ